MAQHKLSTAVFAQGWLESQFESFVNRASQTQAEDPAALVIATNMQEQWNIVSTTLDELIKENAELRQRLDLVQAALV